ncbi:MAG TPA: 1,6-anhydro-N-acetylmuramyl-L-alanine amidase AmpD [Gammaproteobacteria bacterium]|nr:1,6-anhydro-N-acetylmuramyl-L-alanine amidase AmpD [Gammaproteobacteria bacterium]
MKLNVDTGLVQESYQLVSPNYDQRPDPDDISLLVIHGISLPPGRFGGQEVEQFFCNKLDCKSDPALEPIQDLKVSSHFYIRRDGDLVQFVPVHERAWHAGKSRYKQRDHCNDFSIGIELEGTDDTRYTDQQYSCLAGLIQCLLDACPGLSAKDITGHSDIAPGRKTDPGEYFDWPRLRQMIESSQGNIE